MKALSRRALFALPLALPAAVTAAAPPKRPAIGDIGWGGARYVGNGEWRYPKPIVDIDTRVIGVERGLDDVLTVTTVYRRGSDGRLAKVFSLEPSIDRISRCVAAWTGDAQAERLTRWSDAEVAATLGIDEDPKRLPERGG